MTRISLQKIADKISGHVLAEVRRCGHDSLWYNYQGVIELIKQYGMQRERDGIRKATSRRAKRR